MIGMGCLPQFVTDSGDGSGVAISVSDNDNDVEDQVRLHRVIGHVVARFGIDIVREVTHLHDHKGTLTVVWLLGTISMRQHVAFAEAWESWIACECRTNVEHRYKSIDGPSCNVLKWEEYR